MNKLLKISIFMLFIFIILIFPIKIVYKDGGTIEFKALLYKYIIWNSMDDDYENGYKTGEDFYFFPLNLHDLDYYREPKPYSLYFKLENSETEVKAKTGSYCWTSKENVLNKNICVDKISPAEMNYREVLNVKANEKIIMTTENANINKVSLYSVSEEKNIEDSVKFYEEEKYLLVPELEGEYLLIISASFDEGNVGYSLKININK